jgi:hypothetical protein
VIKRDSAYCDPSNQSEIYMTRQARNLILTDSQAACLVALRHRKNSKAGIAIRAKLDLINTAAAIRAIVRLGLAKQDPTSVAYNRAREDLPFRPFRIDRGATVVFWALAPSALKF